MHLSFLSFALVAGTHLALADPSISSFPNSLTLSAPFDPIQPAYWTGLPHHRRTPFAVSPDGKSAYLAYLDSSKKNVIVQQVDTAAFTAVGTAVTIGAYEAAGLVAQNDGFALMATINATGTSDLPPNNMPIVAIIRYKNGAEAWRRPLNGPGVHPAAGLSATPDANGDLVYSSTSGLYAAYFVVTAYTGDATGHFGDSIQYVDDTGALQEIPASSTFGCSHNTGIGLEAADAPPFASVCAEDNGAIWLNTETQYMDGEKIANENTTNGVSGEPMGGMSGSYSNLARFPSSTNYVFAWQSRGAKDLTTNTWLGAPFTQCSPRWLHHNVAIATLSSKNTLAGAEASSTVGAVDGDTHINWITKSDTDDHQNVHVAAISASRALVTWETLLQPTCQPLPLGCTGTYAGTSFQIIDSAGAKVGAAVTDPKVFVSGDMVNLGNDRVCWPYVDMTWDLSAPKDAGPPVTQMSFACAGTGGGSAVVTNSREAGVPPPTATAPTLTISADSPPVVASAAPTPDPSLVPSETDVPRPSYLASSPPSSPPVSELPAGPPPVVSTPAYEPPATTSQLAVPDPTPGPPLESLPVAYPPDSGRPSPTAPPHALPTGVWPKKLVPTGARAHLGEGLGRHRFPWYRATTFATYPLALPTATPAEGVPCKEA
ncbi:hypothetical protein QTJ16_005542 [Diplocarpon rosae]|uniref:Uncharacterized protein n=1 Tax=Diplocarpon rosae TaxID=946125 RepID=A0AAD9WCG7_9HELO|nr:hypothetical protein QTJ16_005542 [Diplocarpon rosae]